MSLSKYNKTTKELEPIAGGFDVQGILDDIGDLTELDTTDKSSLVDAINEVNSGKVDKVEGKGLSTNDYDNTEKGKVADNTAAIGAINENGCCNVLQNKASTTEINGVTFTVNSDGTVDVTGTPTDSANIIIQSIIPEGTYKVSGCPSGGSISTYYMDVWYMDGTWESVNNPGHADIGEGEVVTSTASRKIQGVAIVIRSGTNLNLHFEPMIYDARLNPSCYVRYSMTNEQLTESVGALSNLNTTAKNNLVTAVNEVNGKVINYIHDSWHGLTLNETKIGNLYIATISGTPTEDVPAWSQMGLYLLSSNNVCFVSNEVFALQGFVIKNTTNLTANTYYYYMLVCFTN